MSATSDALSSLNRRRFLTLAATIPIAHLAVPARAQEWNLLGESKVNLIKNFSIIPVTLARGLFSGLMIEVADKPVFIESVEVTFTNGDTTQLAVRSFINAGSRTRKMLLPGLVRGIRAVKIIYKRIPTGGTATVRVYGRQN